MSTLRTSGLASLALLLAFSLASCTENRAKTDSRRDTVPSGDTVAGGTTDSALLPVPAPDATPGVTEGWVVNTTGIGAIEVGTSRTEVERVLGHALVGLDSTSECFYLRSSELPEGILFMFTGGTLARIDIVSDSIPTSVGAHVGFTKKKIEELYPGQVTATPHEYVDGEYLAVPITGSKLRLVFETNKGVVTRYRIGRMPEVEWVEGCS